MLNSMRYQWAKQTNFSAAILKLCLSVSLWANEMSDARN